MRDDGEASHRKSEGHVFDKREIRAFPFSYQHTDVY